MADHPLTSSDRLPKESSIAFAAYQRYRDLGPTRSLGEVTRQLLAARAGSGLRIISQGQATKQPGKHEHNGAVSLWSRKFHWVARAAAWDAVVDQHLREKQLDDIGKMAKRHAGQNEILLQDFMAPAVAFAKILQDPVRAKAVFESVDPKELAKIMPLFNMVAVGAVQVPRLQKAERLARGVKVVDTEPVSRPESAQGGAIWNVTVHQPERLEPAPELAIAGPQSDEWEDAKE